MIARDASGISAICAFEVNRAGFLGPVASRPDLIGRGAGRPALVGALHELRRRVLRLAVNRVHGRDCGRPEPGETFEMLHGKALAVQVAVGQVHENE